MVNLKKNVKNRKKARGTILKKLGSVWFQKNQKVRKKTPFLDLKNPKNRKNPKNH